MKENLKSINRREFIGTTGAVAAGLTITSGFFYQKVWAEKISGGKKNL